MSFRTQTVTVDYGEKKIPAALTTPTSGAGTVCIVLAHGAGGDMNSKQLVLLAEAIAAEGVSVLRFTCRGLNIKYRTQVYAKVVNFLTESSFGIKEIFLAGRSMGSRAAVNVANENLRSEKPASIQGVICLSYPLYPPGTPSKMRDAPLYDIPYPIIFISGDKDDMCKKDKMEEVLKSVPRSEMHWIENAGHDLINKTIGIEKTVKSVVAKIIQWCSKIYPEIITGDREIAVPEKGTRTVGREKCNESRAKTSRKRKRTMEEDA